ncbi:Uncharacterised protein [Weeksella virosa]|uniref:hypothetical protein n=1 Tax=Weeksella virosa TaxID=1014 RepID=UPI000DFE2372|nr:hypothetical protein [Weeksella virosa]SUP53747.1 Uncharacterised protein [Weeksella virosa]
MYKKNIYLLILLFAISSLYAQVGINTDNPQQLFHVDGQKNNPTTGSPSADQQKDDVVITVDGRLGIGTIAPTEKLDVNGRARIRVTDSLKHSIASPLYVDENGLVGKAITYKIAASVPSTSVRVIHSENFNKGSREPLYAWNDKFPVPVNTLNIKADNFSYLIPEEGDYMLSSSIFTYATFAEEDSTSSKLLFIGYDLEIQKKGETKWTRVAGTRKTFHRIGNIINETISIPTAIVRLDAGSHVRLVVYRTRDKNGVLQGDPIKNLYIGGLGQDQYKLNIKKL